MSRVNRKFRNPLSDRWFLITDPSELDLIPRNDVSNLLYLPKKWL